MSDKYPRAVKTTSSRLEKPVLKQGTQFDLFDRRPIEIPGFRLCARRVEVTRKPTISEWMSAFELVHATKESSPLWIGDLWNIAEARSEWREQLPQALADIGLDLKLETLQQYGWVARHSGPEARDAAPSYSHLEVVADLDDKAQVELLEQARQENLSKRDLAKRKKQRSRPATITGQATLEGMYRVIYADPPWSMRNSQPSGSNAADHFPPMSIEDICNLPVSSHALPDSVLFCWVTAPMLYENPGPREVIEAWGFKPKTGIVWDKVRHVFGNYVSVRHEHLIIATRGSCTPEDLKPMIDSVQTVRREGEHSEKPEDFRQIIERLYPTGPYLELFGRKRHRGWSVFGNDARLWAKQARQAAIA